MHGKRVNPASATRGPFPVTCFGSTEDHPPDPSERTGDDNACEFLDPLLYIPNWKHESNAFEYGRIYAQVVSGCLGSSRCIISSGIRSTCTTGTEDDDSRQPWRWLGPDRSQSSSGHAERQTCFLRAVRQQRWRRRYDRARSVHKLVK